MKSLVFAIAITVAALYIPGFLFLRSIRFSRLTAAVCAPIVAFFLYAAMPIAYGFLGIGCNPFTVGLIPLALCLACYVAARMLRKQTGPIFSIANPSSVSIGSRSVPFEWLALGLYVVIGAFACWFMFVSQLGGAEAFTARWDNQFHLNVIRSFLDSGQWSSLGVSTYATSPDNAIPYIKYVERYPAAWHDAVTLVCATSGRSVAVCVNALNIVLAGLVYPSAMFLLIKSLFPSDRLAVIAGAGIASAFTAFPWGLFVKGPLYANFAGFTLMVMVIAATIAFVGHPSRPTDETTPPSGFARHARCSLARQMPGPFVVFAIISFIALGLAHPNALVSAFVFLAACASHAIGSSIRASNRLGTQRGKIVAILGSIAVIIVAGLLLVACSYAPPLQSIVQYHTASKLTTSSAIESVALLNLGKPALVRTAPEYLLALIAGCGIVYCLVKRKFWLLLPAAYMAVAFVVACPMDISVAKLISGLWYNDPVRLAACYELFLAPIAAYGLAGLTRLPAWIRTRFSNGNVKRSDKPSVGTAFVITAVTIALFVPSLPLPGGSTLMFGIGEQQKFIHSQYTTGKKAVYPKRERSFVKKARNAIPEGSLVLNQPHDGSMFAYGLDNLNTYYRKLGSKEQETDASKLIRTRLADFARDPAVYEAVKSTGAEYLIMLDQGIDKETGRWMLQYKENQWAGINAVNDDTPGFTAVLEDDDMRLYRIEYDQSTS